MVECLTVPVDKLDWIAPLVADPPSIKFHNHRQNSPIRQNDINFRTNNVI